MFSVPRRLFTVASLLSLSLCLATVVMWVRSYWIADWIEFCRDDGSVRAEYAILIILVLVLAVVLGVYREIRGICVAW